MAVADGMVVGDDGEESYWLSRSVRTILFFCGGALCDWRVRVVSDAGCGISGDELSPGW